MNTTIIFAFNLKKYRHLANFSQQQLANKTGLHRTYISGIEQGRRNPTIKQLDKIAKALDTKPWKMLQPPSSNETVPKGHYKYNSQKLI